MGDLTNRMVERLDDTELPYRTPVAPVAPGGPQDGQWTSYHQRRDDLVKQLTAWGFAPKRNHHGTPGPWWERGSLRVCVHDMHRYAPNHSEARLWEEWLNKAEAIVSDLAGLIDHPSPAQPPVDDATSRAVKIVQDFAVSVKTGVMLAFESRRNDADQWEYIVPAVELGPFVDRGIGLLVGQLEASQAEDR